MKKKKIIDKNIKIDNTEKKEIKSSISPKKSPIIPIIIKYSYTSNILEQLRDSFSL